MTIAEVLKLEQQCRKIGKWFIVNEEVVNDHGVSVHVQLKNFGFYNQIFRINKDGIDYAKSHAISTVGDMKKHITNTINGVS